MCVCVIEKERVKEKKERERRGKRERRGGKSFVCFICLTAHGLFNAKICFICKYQTKIIIIFSIFHCIFNCTFLFVTIRLHSYMESSIPILHKGFAQLYDIKYSHLTQRICTVIWNQVFPSYTKDLHSYMVSNIPVWHKGFSQLKKNFL